MEKKMQNLGYLLTCLLTLPIIGLVIWGVTGGVIGLIVGVVLAVGSVGAEKEKQKKEEGK